ncbi:hypothetical protein [Streptomyces sp. DH8]|uniref:hypothetical protein n=1 Tax=Streptomyces sp. DH8 TaxID=2857008 RepID=UPI001E42169A|nr:hypothetical protein [Streptomyces sp. DH8]
MTKRGIMEQDGPRAGSDVRGPGGAGGTDRATGRAGALLCWTHALAMVLTAAEAVLRPPAGWWSTAWIGSWVLTGVLLVVWALLRADRKRRYREDGRPGGDGVPDPKTCDGCCEGAPEEYGTAA